MFIIENITDIFLPIWTLWVRCVWLILCVLSKKNYGKFAESSIFFAGFKIPLSSLLECMLLRSHDPLKHVFGELVSIWHLNTKKLAHIFFLAYKWVWEASQLTYCPNADRAAICSQEAPFRRIHPLLLKILAKIPKRTKLEANQF